MAAAAAAGSAVPDGLVAGHCDKEPTFAELRSFQKAVELAAAGGASRRASKIVLIGPESTAKSATISALVPGLHLLSGAESTTKVPTVITASHAEVGRVTLSAKVETETITVVIPESDLKEKLSAAFADLQKQVVGADKGAVNGYSMQEIHMDVHLPGCANISLVDLPGHVLSHPDSQKQTLKIITKYLDQDNSIPVVLVPCGTNPSSTSLLRLLADRNFGKLTGTAEEVFSPGPRCFYIRSKADMASPDDLEAILTHSIDVERRVFVLASMPGGTHLATASEEYGLLMSRLSQCSIDQSLLAEVIGAGAFSKKLQELLVCDLRKHARPMLHEARDRTIELSKLMEAIPKDCGNVGHAAEEFAKFMHGVLKRPGASGSDSLAVAAAVLVREFETKLQRTTLEHVATVDWDQRRRADSSPLQQSGQAVDERVIQDEADRLSDKLRRAARTFASKLTDCVRDGLMAAINHHEAESTTVLAKARAEVAKLTEGIKDELLTVINSAAEESKSFAPSSSIMLGWPDAKEVDTEVLAEELYSAVGATAVHLAESGVAADPLSAPMALQRWRVGGRAYTMLHDGVVKALKAARDNEADSSELVAEQHMSPQADLLRQAKMRATIFGLRIHRAAVDLMLGGVETFFRAADFEAMVELDMAKVEGMVRRRAQLADQSAKLHEAERLLSELVPSTGGRTEPEVEDASDTDEASSTDDASAADS